MSPIGRTDQPVRRDPLDAEHLKVGLKARSLRNAGIVLASQGGRFVVQLGALVAMAHLVAPEAFGVFGVVTAIVAFGIMFANGLSIGTVQRENLSQDQSSGVFWINLAVGLVLAIATCASAPFVASFYRKPELAPLLIAMSSSYIFFYLGSQQLSILKRQMRFGVLGIIDQVSMFFSVALGIFCAWRGCGVWSFAYVQISMSVINCAGVWIASDWRPTAFKSNCGLKALLLYGKDLAISDVATYLTRNLDNLLIGRACGAIPLGFYDRAYTMVMVPLQQLLTPLGHVAHTMLSRLQKEPNSFRSYAQTSITISCGLGMPVCMYLCVGAHRIVPVILGKQWGDCVPILQALAPGAVIDCFIMGISIILLALGRTREFLLYRVLATVLAVVAFFLGVHWGPLGVAIGVSLSRLFAGIVCAVLCSSCSESPVRWADMRRAATAPCLAALAAGVAVTVVDRSICSTSNQYANLFLSGATFSLLYIAAWAVQQGQVQAIKAIIAMSFEKQSCAEEPAQTDTVQTGDTDISACQNGCADKSSFEELVLK